MAEMNREDRDQAQALLMNAIQKLGDAGISAAADNKMLNPVTVSHQARSDAARLCRQALAG
jgi:hypothetical protein